MADIPPSSISDLKLGTTPETIVVSRDGLVLRDWRGAYTGATKQQMEEFFSMGLPDLLD